MGRRRETLLDGEQYVLVACASSCLIVNAARIVAYALARDRHAHAIWRLLRILRQNLFHLPHNKRPDRQNDRCALDNGPLHHKGRRPLSREKGLDEFISLDQPGRF